MSTTRIALAALAIFAGLLVVEAVNVCCDDLGCFDSEGDFFNALYRPVPSVPQCELGAQIYLRLKTRDNQVETQTLNPYATSTIRESNFKSKRKTKILIHGWLDKYTRTVWKEIAAALLQDGDYNVIHVDWSAANWFPYVQAAGNLRLVGAYTAKFIKVIVSEFKVNPADIHVIGHSLGSHGAGYTGSYAQSNYSITVGRITGLDPAGPYYTNMPVNVRLDPSDAEEVDTMITNGDTLAAMGSPQAMGHLNFYPNGGVDQPGCAKGLLNILFTQQQRQAVAPVIGVVSELPRPIRIEDNPFDMLAKIFAAEEPRLVQSDFVRNKILDLIDKTGCSHTRALTLFRDGISNSSCSMKAYQCDSYELFMNGKGGCDSCNGSSETHSCSPMGFRADISLADRSRVKRFYTVTTATSPYCPKLRVQFTLKNGTSQQEGKVYLTLFGTESKSEKILLTPKVTTLKPGQTYVFLPEIAKNLGDLESAVIYWESKGNLFSISNLLSKDYIELDAAGLRVTDPSDDFVSIFMPSKAKIVSRQDVAATLTKTTQA